MFFLLFSMAWKGRSEGSQQNGIAGSPLLVSQCRTCRRTCSLEPIAPEVLNFPPAPSKVGGNGFLGLSKQGYLFLQVSGAKIILCFNTFFGLPCGPEDCDQCSDVGGVTEETQNDPNLDTLNS